MSTALNPTLHALLLAALLTSPTARAEDWPQWRGLAQDGHAAARAKVPEKLAETPKVTWRLKIGDGLASPVVAQGNLVYFDAQAGKETLHLISADTAKEAWSHPIDDTFKDSQSAPGPRCTPLIDGDRVYAQSCRGELKCLRIADGSEVWSVSYVKDLGSVFTGEKGNASGATRHGYNGSPVVRGTTLLVLAGSTNGGGLACLDKNTGKVLWKSLNEQAGYAPPVIARIAGRDQILAFMVDGLIGADVRDGKELWRTPIKTSFARHVTTPVVAGDLVIVSSHQAGMIATRLEPEGKSVRASQTWTSKETMMNFASPVVVGKQIYGLGPARNLFCADAATGTVRWSKDGFFNTSADKSHAAFLVLGRNVLTLTDGGMLVLFAADPKEFKSLGQAQVCGSTWCNPAYANGHLYLRDKSDLIALQLL